MFGAFRLLLAMFVVVSHLAQWTILGGFAVFNFYCLSGYLMTLIVKEKYPSFAPYALNRFLRIYPTYWAALVLTLVLMAVGGPEISKWYSGAYQFPESITGWLKQVLIVISYKDEIRPVSQAWALTVELIFYLLIGLGIGRSKTSTAIWLGVAILIHFVPLEYFGFWSRYMTAPAAALPFALGAMIYHHRPRLGPWWFWAVAWGTNCYFGHNDPGNLVYYYLNIGLGAGLINALSNFQPSKFDSALGDYSYPIYVSHYAAGFIVTLLVGINKPSWNFFFMTLPVLFLLNWMIVNMLDIPIQKVRKIVASKGSQ